MERRRRLRDIVVAGEGGRTTAQLENASTRLKAFPLTGRGKNAATGNSGKATPRGGLHIKRQSGQAKKVILWPNSTRISQEQLRADGLPTIQGIIALFDADNGYPLALLDSTDITIKRTAAASAVAAKYLARTDSTSRPFAAAAGRTGSSSRDVRCSPTHQSIFVRSWTAAASKTSPANSAVNSPVEAVSDSAQAIQKSDVCVTCTTRDQILVHKADVPPALSLPQWAQTTRTNRKSIPL